jgi:hypothetical protein
VHASFETAVAFDAPLVIANPTLARALAVAELPTEGKTAQVSHPTDQRSSKSAAIRQEPVTVRPRRQFCAPAYAHETRAPILEPHHLAKLLIELVEWRKIEPPTFILEIVHYRNLIHGLIVKSST